MNFKKIITALSLALLISSCTTSSPLELRDSLPVDLNNITYQQNVKKIIDANCIQCHGTTPTNGAPMSLTTYANVRDAVSASGTRGIINRIERNPGDGLLMPQGGPKLQQDDINIIKIWQTQGFTE